MANVASQSVENIKKAALAAVAASMPAGVYFGTVINDSPLQISIEQKITLTKAQLILSSLVQDYEVEMTVDHTTEETRGGSGEDSFDSHSHEYKGKKKFKVHLALKKDERVMLLRMQGGQRYIVLDRIRG